MITTSKGKVTDNNVKIEQNATVKGDVFGAKIAAGNGHALKNSVVIDSATVDGNITGGFTTGSNFIKANENRVTIQNGAKVKGHVFGGDSKLGVSSENSVSVNSATVDGNITAGYNGQTADKNSVTIKDANVTGHVRAGKFTITGATTNENTVTISGNSEVNGTIIAGDIFKGASANKNKVIIKDNAKVNNHVLAAYFKEGQQGEAAEANENSVTISDNAIVSAKAGTTEYVVAADIEKGKRVDRNSITIDGNAKVTANVLAAHTRNGDEANENNV
ncbi:MAG: hypothetical protein SOU37_02150, partial [Campylobacter lanienae]|nr:hypothetical protein [Campylobacteraceae bacterium]MDY2817403.1 hypothetical protein [Campylobacter lanienae]